MNTDNDRIKRIEEFLLDPERALFTTLEEFRTAIDELLPIVREIDIAKLTTLKGEDGRTPQRGTEYMTADDLNALEQFILSKMPQTDVDFPSVQATEAFIKSEVAKIPRVKGDRGEDGRAGTRGKDGSPDSGADILRKLRTLGRNQGLQIDDIRGLENRLKIYNTAVDELAALREEFNNQRFVIPANLNSGGGAGGGVTSVNGQTGAVSVVGDGTTITGTGTIADPFVAVGGGGVGSWGFYTPTPTDEANLDSLEVFEARWTRVGDIVTVTGGFEAQPTLPSTFTGFRLPPPIPTLIFLEGGEKQIAGVAFCGSVSGQGAQIVGEQGDNVADLYWVASDTTLQYWSYTYSYQVIEGEEPPPPG